MLEEGGLGRSWSWFLGFGGGEAPLQIQLEGKASPDLEVLKLAELRNVLAAPCTTDPVGDSRLSHDDGPKHT